jgi:glycine cleavage system H protein
MQTPEELRYSAEHEWVRVDGDTATVGITDFAQDALGDIVFVQVPDTGDDVIAGASISEIESTKSVSDIYAPVSGTVVETNEALQDSPELINQDPYGQGWIMRIRLVDAAQVDALLDAAGYRSLTEAGQ